jgi:hemerythrin-like domain-containing protein
VTADGNLRVTPAGSAEEESATAHMVVGMMFAIHGAIQRDLDRMVTVLPVSLVDGEQRVPAVPLLTYWRRFTDQLEHHHEIEDTEIWPHLRERQGRRQRGILHSIDVLQAEHGRIVAAYQQADAALIRLTTVTTTATVGTARLCLVAFRDLVLAHLRHEEFVIVPLLFDQTDEAFWQAFAERRQADLGPDEFLPWVLDRAVPEASRAIRRGLSDQVVELLDAHWQPAHQRMVAALSDPPLVA